MSEMMIFDPVLYSHQENEFLAAHVGEPAIVAFKDPLPKGVNPKAVRPLIERVFELQQLEQHDGTPWAGVQAIRDAIKVYQEQTEKWAKDRRRGRPRFPSLYVFDQKGRGRRGGPGSDSSRVKTYFNSNGERVPFAIYLVGQEEEAWAPEWHQADLPTPSSSLKVDDANRRVECLVCGHTESFNPESRGSQNAAMGRMKRHLAKDVRAEFADKHREVLSQEFGN